MTREHHEMLSIKAVAHVVHARLIYLHLNFTTKHIERTLKVITAVLAEHHIVLIRNTETTHNILLRY